MEAKLHAFWIIVECPNCHKPQVINKWVNNGAVYNFASVRPYECNLCESHFEVNLQVKGSEGEPLLAPASPAKIK